MVDRYIGHIKEFAQKHKLPGFKIGYFYSSYYLLVAGHVMYERSNPYYEHFAGGMLDMTNCCYEQYDEKTCRITGPKFIPADEIRI